MPYHFVSKLFSSKLVPSKYHQQKTNLNVKEKLFRPFVKCYFLLQSLFNSIRILTKELFVDIAKETTILRIDLLVLLKQNPFITVLMKSNRISD